MEHEKFFKDGVRSRSDVQTSLSKLWCFCASLGEQSADSSASLLPLVAVASLHRHYCPAGDWEGYEVEGIVGEHSGRALLLRLSAARVFINAKACDVSEDLSKNRSAPSRRLRFWYSAFA